MIRAGVLTTWRVGDKTSRRQWGDKRCRRYLPPSKPPIFLTIYSIESAVAANERTATVVEVARVVADAFQIDNQKAP